MELFNKFILEEVADIKKSDAPFTLIYFTTDDVTDGCDVFEKLTGINADAMLKANHMNRDKISGFTIGLEIENETGCITQHTISPTADDEDCFTDFDIHDAVYYIDELVEFVKTYADNNRIPADIKENMHV